MNLDPLPPAFVRNVVSYFPNGRRWLADLPQCIAALAARWQLQTLRPVASLSFNFVALATESRHGREVVLKVSPDPSVIAAESAWLLHHAGNDVVGVLATSTDAYLMECLSPGLPLDPASLPEDRQTAREIAALISGLSRSPPPANQEALFRDVAQDSSGFADYSRVFGDRGPVDARLVDAAKRVWCALVTSPSPPCLVHGDLHHGNVLVSVRGDGTLRPTAIDPHGLVAETEYECAAMLRNRLGWCPNEATLARAVTDRVAILADVLALDARRIAGWGFAQTVLSACWEALATKGVQDVASLAAAQVLRRRFEGLGGKA
ncbi:MAG: phosphotransferase [Gammaproteobacteria bacterium]|nr:phosphotransferase [Gammaproteobacteria bacterium]